MAAPAPSQLDADQCIRGAYDDSTGTLRTTANVDITVPSGLEVAISAENDSIAIGDPDGNLVTIAPGTDPTRTGLDVNVISGVSGDFTPNGLKTGLRTQKIIVGDTPTALPAVALTDRNGISVRVWGTSTIFVGDSSVTADQGYPRRQFEEIQLDITNAASVTLYGICESGQSCEVRIIEIA